MEELQRQAAWAETFGLPLHLVSAEEAQKLFPPMSIDGVLGAAFLPTDGYLDPSQLTLALAKGARQRGATILTETRVTGIEVAHGRVRGGRDRQGPDRVRDRRQRRRHLRPRDRPLAGVHVPVVPMAHQYVITKPAGLPRDMPTVRDPSLLVYFRGESGGLVAGGYERNPAPWGLDGHPGRLQQPAPAAGLGPVRAALRSGDGSRARARRRRDRPARQRPRGLHPRRRVHPRAVRGAAASGWRPGFCAHGIAGSGGMGRLMAEWIIDGQPGLDAWEMDSRRFGPQYRSRELRPRAHDRGLRHLLRRQVPRPRAPGRPAAARAARLRSGCEPSAPPSARRAAGSGSTGSSSNEAAGDESLRPDGWAGRLWSPAVGAEHRACRETAALFDETSFAKLEVIGPGAAAFLEHLCANRVARQPGTITYTQLCNPAGGVECDLTVTRLAEDRFRIVTGTAFGNHDLAWLRSHLPGDGSVHLEDVTSRYACLALWGPNARDDPAAAHRDRPCEPGVPLPAAPASSPSGRCRASPCGSPSSASSAGSSTARLSSRSGSGTRSSPAGRGNGLVPGGYKAIESLRLEKGYRVWGSDVTSADTPFEAGLGFAVRMDKEVPFIGRDALAGRRVRRRAGSPASSSTTRAASCSARSRCGSTAARSGGSRAAATATPSAARSPTPTCPRARSSRGGASRSASSGVSSAPRSSPSRSSTRRTPAPRS